MDPDSKRLNDIEIKILKQHGHSLLNDSDVFQSSWIRRFIQTSNGLDRFLLDYGFNFLLRCAIFSWLLFLIEKIY